MEEVQFDVKMFFRFSVLVLLGTGLIVNSERHSLTYIYTAFSKPINLPGIHDFIAMGLLDDIVIDYYDSALKKRVPKVDWMAERLSADYWEKGTQSRQSKQQWFKVNIEILMNRMRQNSSDVHTLQWMHGCTGDMQPDGSLIFYSSMDMYGYDGNDFLSFDATSGIWVAHVVAAEPTKRKWDDVQVLKEYTKGYLEKECMEWLRKFVEFGQAQIQRAEEPEVHVFANNCKVKKNVELTCLATGFHPKEISMLIKRNSRIMTQDDGVKTTDTLPNHDGTYQRRDRIQILREDLGTYTCEVAHKPSDYIKVHTWDDDTSLSTTEAQPFTTNKMLRPPPEEGCSGGGNSGKIVGGVFGGLILLAIVALVVLWKKGIIAVHGRRTQRSDHHILFASQPIGGQPAPHSLIETSPATGGGNEAAPEYENLTIGQEE